ncbi:MAG: hypothetical protein LBH19_00160 [Dysgonamonadaceae bacterium]|jgi:hypothetical protein|nr:hypothetical protein [Dysgonamonadaceae bacterium]
MDKTDYAIHEVTVAGRNTSLPGSMTLSAGQVRRLTALLGEPEDQP